MSALTETLERILKELQKNRPAVASTLQPGLTYKEIQETTTNLPFCLPSEVYKLYQWRNGNELYEFFYYHYFLPLQKAVEICQEIIAINVECDQKTQYEGKPLFPIFDFDGEYWGVVIDENDNQSSAIVFIDEIGEVSKISYISLSNMMLTIAQCYETGAQYLDKDGYLESNSAREESIRQKYNPGSESPWL